MELTTIALAAITERLDARAIHPHGVAALAKTMATLGFLPQFPILVSPKTPQTYRLLDGGHRVEAAQHAGLTEVTALVREPCESFLEEVAVARASNEASGTNVQTTLIDDAELVWRLCETYGQQEVSQALGSGWSRSTVADYVALQKISAEAWNVIVATFESNALPLKTETATYDVAVATKSQPSPFTEGLLRPILSLAARQQLLLCTYLAKGTDAHGHKYTKKNFRDDAEAFAIYNALIEQMHEDLDPIPEDDRNEYILAMVEAFYPGKNTDAPHSEYITEWEKKKGPGPKYAKLLQAQLDAYEKKTHVRVFCADITTLTADDLPDESVDVIITDPPYTAEAVPLFACLAAAACRILKPGGSLIVLCGQTYLPEYLAALSAHLTYRWTLACHMPGGQAVQIWSAEVVAYWKPVLWFVKEPFPGQKWVSDHFSTLTNSNDKRFHKWGQSECCLHELVTRFSSPGETVYDPFLGGGTTGVVCKALNRKFVGSDCDEAIVREALTRIHESA
jgi:SAM-dependent methyltransferase